MRIGHTLAVLFAFLEASFAGLLVVDFDAANALDEFTLLGNRDMVQVEGRGIDGGGAISVDSSNTGWRAATYGTSLPSFAGSGPKRVHTISSQFRLDQVSTVSATSLALGFASGPSDPVPNPSTDDGGAVGVNLVIERQTGNMRLSASIGYGNLGAREAGNFLNDIVGSIQADRWYRLSVEMFDLGENFAMTARLDDYGLEGTGFEDIVFLEELAPQLFDDATQINGHAALINAPGVYRCYLPQHCLYF